MGCHLSGAQQRDGFAVAAVSGLVVGEQCATTGRHSARPGAPARCGNLGQMVTRGLGARSCWPPGRRLLPARTTRPRREYGLAVVSGVLCRRRPERVERLFIDARFATPPPRRVEGIDEPRCTPTVLARVVRDNRAGCDSWWHCWLG